jgi:hypothetical protein
MGVCVFFDGRKSPAITEAAANSQFGAQTELAKLLGGPSNGSPLDHRPKDPKLTRRTEAPSLFEKAAQGEAVARSLNVVTTPAPNGTRSRLLSAERSASSARPLLASTISRTVARDHVRGFTGARPASRLKTSDEG